MEWYYESCLDDLVVPRDREAYDGLPPPTWYRWGVSSSETCGSMNKYFASPASSTIEDPHSYGDNLYKEVDMDFFAHEAEYSSNSNVSQGYQKCSLHQATGPCAKPDFQLNESGGTNQSHDIYLSPEGPNGIDYPHGSFNSWPGFEYGVLLADNLLTEMSIDSDYDPSHLFDVGSSKYINAHSFSPSDSEMRGVASLHTPPSSKHKDSRPVKAPIENVSVSSAIDIMDEQANKETSAEQSVFQELERLMVQLSEKTRICIRDSMYRLAKNSERQTANNCESGEFIVEKANSTTLSDETLRSESTRHVESETNAIDRVIANLMFNKIDSKEQDLAAAASSHYFNQESSGTAGHGSNNLGQPHPPQPPHHAFFADDSKVPIFG